MLVINLLPSLVLVYFLGTPLNTIRINVLTRLQWKFYWGDVVFDGAPFPFAITPLAATTSNIFILAWILSFTPVWSIYLLIFHFVRDQVPDSLLQICHVPIKDQSVLIKTQIVISKIELITTDPRSQLHMF